ncbi:AAA family ATPase [Qipengyuania algicida]|nr:AAA family ATPase [Qipengyuania algicida]
MISGCSGGGKSTLLAELAQRGFSVVPEPGRRIIAEERVSDGAALPWRNSAAFARRALAMSVADYDTATGLTFFDRGIVDAAVALVATGGTYPSFEVTHRRYDRLFIVPPWAEIYENDEDRRHSYDKALTDFERVNSAWIEAGYDPVEIPRTTVAGRADFVLETLGLDS